MSERSPLLSTGDKMEVHGEADVVQSPIPSFLRALETNHTNGVQKLPQAIAHRGYKAQHPENTMGAFKGAVEVGAHAIETDLHITKDGIVVLSHDATLKRCFGREEKIIDCEWSFLETLETLQEPREKMPRFKDLLEYLATPGLDDIWVLLDIKLDNDPEDIMRLIASTTKEVAPSSRPWNERILLGCWAAKQIPLSQKYLPTYPITHIGFSISYARKFLNNPSLPPISFNMLQKILVGPFGSSFLAEVKAKERVIFVWTVNEVGWMRWGIRKEVDGVVTDDPKLFLEVCEKYQGEVVKGKKVGDGVSLWGWVVVVWIHVLVILLGPFVRWKFQVGDVDEAVGKKKGGKVAL